MGAPGDPLLSVVGPGVEQLGNSLLPALASQRGGRLPHRLNVRVCTSFQQDLDDLGSSKLRGLVQSSESIVIRGIHIRSVVEQEAGSPGIALSLITVPQQIAHERATHGR